MTICVPLHAPAQTGSEEARPESGSDRKAAPTRKQPRPTAEMQQRVQEFAAAHHAELETLLTNLRKKSRPEYDTAVHQLFTTLERLERTQKRDPERYEVDLRAWQLDTTVQVLAARLSMTRDPEIQEQLRDALQDRLEIRLEQLKLERKRVEGRLKQIESNLTELQQQSDEAIQRDLDRILRIVRSRESTSRRQPEQTGQRSKKTTTESPPKANPPETR
jgi:hypothetical protein